MRAPLVHVDASPAWIAFSARLVLRPLAEAVLTAAAGRSTALRDDFTVRDQSFSEISVFPDVRVWVTAPSQTTRTPE